MGEFDSRAGGVMGALWDRGRLLRRIDSWRRGRFERDLVEVPNSSAYAWFSALPGPMAGLLVGLCYLVLAQYVIWLNDPVNAGAGYWPANGVTLAAFLILPVRRWGWIVAAVVVAEIGGGAFHGYPVGASAWWAAGNVAEPIVAALLLRRFGSGGRLVPLGALGSFFVAAVVLGPLIGAALGSVGTSTVYGSPLADVVLKWWIGDGLGVLVVTPLLLSFREESVRGPSRVEQAVVVSAVVVVTLLVFRDWNRSWDPVLPYVIFPAMIWAGVRLGVRGAAITGFFVAELANLATALGYGPLGEFADSAGHALTELQVFVAVGLTSGLVAAVLVRDTLEAGKRYERQRSITEVLQSAALPERLPPTPGLSLAARHQAASDDGTVRVGGDWYDAFVLSDGSSGFVIGDVTGHGLESARVMVEVRNGLRSLLMELADPARAMAAMDEQLRTGHELTLVTAIAALYKDGQLFWTNAGHPPLLHAPHRGPVQYLTSDANSTLGLDDGRYDIHQLHLEPGDVVIAYTDGVVEHRARPIDQGFGHLLRLVEDAADRDPGALCELLLEHGLDGLDGHDDACVLAIRR